MAQIAKSQEKLLPIDQKHCLTTTMPSSMKHAQGARENDPRVAPPEPLIPGKIEKKGKRHACFLCYYHFRCSAFLHEVINFEWQKGEVSRTRLTQTWHQQLHIIVGSCYISELRPVRLVYDQLIIHQSSKIFVFYMLAVDGYDRNLIHLRKTHNFYRNQPLKPFASLPTKKRKEKAAAAAAAIKAEGI